jgi:heme/copper-type cytochrome/quinol oxidase subunit 4
MDKIQIIKGFSIGLLANAFGLFIVGTLMAKFSGRNDGILTVLEAAQSENFLGKLISLGAILNLICFFYFIRKKKDANAAGVLIATIFIALITFIIKL